MVTSYKYNLVNGRYSIATDCVFAGRALHFRALFLHKNETTKKSELASIPVSQRSQLYCLLYP